MTQSRYGTKLQQVDIHVPVNDMRGKKIYIHPTASQRCQLWNWTNSLQIKLKVRALTNVLNTVQFLIYWGASFWQYVCASCFIMVFLMCLVFKLYAFFYWLSTFIFVFEELKYEEYPGEKVNNFHSYSKLDFSCLGSDLHCLTYTFWLAFIYSQSERNKNAAVLHLTDFCVK